MREPQIIEVWRQTASLCDPSRTVRQVGDELEAALKAATTPPENERVQEAITTLRLALRPEAADAVLRLAAALEASEAARRDAEMRAEAVEVLVKSCMEAMARDALERR